MLKKIETFFPKITKLDLLFLLIVIAIAALAWNGILNQVIEGEGYYYFSPNQNFINPDGSLTDVLHNFDNFSRLSTDILEYFYKGEIQPYMNFQFITLVLIHGSFYLLLRKLTNRPWLALIGAVYFAANYSGNFQFYARGHYHWFTQRVPELFPVFISVYFLIHYVNVRKISFYFLAILFFILAIFTSHYTTMFLPLFIGITLSSAIFKTGLRSERIQLVLLGIPFLLLNYLIASGSSLSFGTINPNQTLWESILATNQSFIKILYQLVVVTVPFSLLKQLSMLFKLGYQPLIYYLMLPVVLFYLLTFIILLKRKFAHIHLVLGVFIGMLGALFLNVYLHRVNIFNEIEQGRYYYVAGLYVGIIFASLIDTLLVQSAKKRVVNFLRYGLIVTLLMLWVIPNTSFIWKKIHDSQYSFTGGRVTLNYLKNLQPKLAKNSAVLVPNPIMPNGVDFLKKYYGDGTTAFLYIDSKWQEALPENFNPNNLFAFEYNEEYKLGGRSRIYLIEFVDISDTYRQKLK